MATGANGRRLTPVQSPAEEGLKDEQDNAITLILQMVVSNAYFPMEAVPEGNKKVKRKSVRQNLVQVR